MQQGLPRPRQHRRLGPDHGLAPDEADIPDGPFGNPPLAIDEQGVVEPCQHRLTPRAGQAEGGGVLQMRDFSGIDLSLETQRRRQRRGRRRQSRQDTRLNHRIGRAQADSVGEEVDPQAEPARAAVQRLSHAFTQQGLRHGEAEQVEGLGLKSGQMQVETPHPAVLHLHRGEGAVVGQDEMAQIGSIGGPAVDLHFSCHANLRSSRRTPGASKSHTRRHSLQSQLLDAKELGPGVRRDER
ncbi:hypothetical protein D3C85_1233570 [compost metagenome]